MARLSGSKLDRIRAAVIARDGRVCQWCGVGLQAPPSDPHAPLPADTFTLDHVIPRANGGTDQVNNIVAACFRCNQRRNQETGSAGLLTNKQLMEIM